ncbi:MULTISPECIES: ShlB/FhaC/HecB family hemolysin secretion/activation protein [unclassified Pseudomonas]|uniref:ShlB/FhaC/HecB family hemolysin secretion/activation protein n=1 Tax=unclassified Pseudomonas TaxID=196821 RepID=UPI0021BA5E07|nr:MULTISPECIES: ShlB/FhaC/HecB family hemolysin secretion/activation protein [unclassified Pseudomonas]MCT8162923.1 ShlB/FhaC/HecB family hemolysin secretion/activation protein [Pseudomonas sp. HD6422]MCT8181617.1 ShlB/FhaC/HecB family hemolysin secretion/activation protein [Pseudomonas sp. HD6421]
MPSRFSRYAGRLLACCLTAASSLPWAWADDPASRHLRDQQHSQQQLEQQLRLQRWQRAPAHPDLDPPPVPPAETNRCWAITGVRLAGHQQLSAQALEAAVRAQLPPCMGIDDINQLLRAITQVYVQAGYPASRPYLSQPPQDGQPLDILLVEGFVESIELGTELPLWLQGAFPDLLGQPLYLPALEQGLDQLNRLRAFELSADLLPGTRPGATHVQVKGQQVARRWHLDSRFDNRGSDLTGRHRLNLGLGLDSPLGLNDDLRVSLSSTVLDAPGRSQGLSVYYSLPYGFWTFAINATQSSYSAPIPQSARISSGSSSYQGVSAERLLWRNQQGMLSASARLDRKRLLNRTGKTEIALQSPTLTSLEAGINLLWLDDGLWHGFLGVARGVDWLGADRSALNQDAPRPDFLKYRGTLLHLRQGPANRPWRWQSELNLQYSRDSLPAAEQLVASDDSTVRGFRLSSYGGASGAVWRNTFSHALTLPLTQPLQIRPYIGLDLGWTRLLQSSNSQHLAGAASGVELSLSSSRLRLDYQRALHASDKPRSGLESGFWVLEWSLNI